MRTMCLELLTTDEIYLSKEEYNATKSKIKFQLAPIDPKKWTQLRNMPLHVVSRRFRKILQFFESFILFSWKNL